MSPTVAVFSHLCHRRMWLAMGYGSYHPALLRFIYMEYV